jgi:putative membrane protein
MNAKWVRVLRRASVACAAAATISLVACSSDSSERSRDRDRGRDRDTMSTRDTGTRDGGALDRPTILATLISANDAEVQAGRLAADRARSNEVRRFAQMMVDDHSDANRKVREAASRLNARPSNDASVREMERHSQDDLNRLRGLRGDDFDRAYMQAQVQGHRDLLSKIDSQMMTGGRTDEMHSLLQDTRQLVQRHLDEAQRVERTLR